MISFDKTNDCNRYTGMCCQKNKKYEKTNNVDTYILCNSKLYTLKKFLYFYYYKFQFLDPFILEFYKLFTKIFYIGKKLKIGMKKNIDFLDFYLNIVMFI